MKKQQKKELEEEIFYGHELPKEIVLQGVTEFYMHDLPNNYEMVKLFVVIYPGPFFPNPEESEGELKFYDFEKIIEETKTNPVKFTPAFILNLEEYLRVMGR